MRITKQKDRLSFALGVFLFVTSTVGWALPEVTDIEDTSPMWQEEGAPDSVRSERPYRERHRGADRRRRTEEASTPSPQTFEQSKKIEYLQQEIQDLRGKVEEQAHAIEQLQEQQKKHQGDLDAAQSVSGLAVPSALAPSSTPALSAELLPVEPNPEEERAYQSAYQLIQNKEYDAALAAFKGLVSNFPQGTYTPNGYYWLGEISLVKGDLALAAQSFGIVFQRYPQHPKAADSLLKLGYIEYANGRWTQAKDLLNRVKAQFPGTTSAQLAQSRLDKIRQEGH